MLSNIFLQFSQIKNNLREKGNLNFLTVFRMYLVEKDGFKKAMYIHVCLHEEKTYTGWTKRMME